MDQSTDTCRVAVCDYPVVVKMHGLCNGHYLQLRAGKPFKALRKSNVPPRGTLQCVAENCDAMSNAPRGLCHRHYWRLRKFGTPNIDVPQERKTPGQPAPSCAVEGCDEDRKCKGYCQSHYNQWARNPGGIGSPIQPRRRLDVRDSSGNKQCRSCDAWLPESDFNRASRTSDGLQSRCRGCAAADYRANASIIRDKMREQRFGLSREAFDALLASQGGVCAICKSEHPGVSFWHVDHDHQCCPSSDKTCGSCVRGVLCSSCNMGLGHLNDDIARMKAAIGYLERYARQVIA